MVFIRRGGDFRALLFHDVFFADPVSGTPNSSTEYNFFVLVYSSNYSVTCTLPAVGLDTSGCPPLLWNSHIITWLLHEFRSLLTCTRFSSCWRGYLFMHVHGSMLWSFIHNMTFFYVKKIKFFFLLTQQSYFWIHSKTSWFILETY